jgi:uncharacterized protein YjbJ (UPF0337 family)
MPEEENNENHFGDFSDRLKEEWDKVSDKTKESWEGVVDRVGEGYHGSTDWTDDKLNEAKGYFKGRFDQMK